MDVADRDVVNVSGTEAIKVPFDDSIKICPAYFPTVSGLSCDQRTLEAQLTASSEVPRRKRLEITKAAARAELTVAGAAVQDASATAVTLRPCGGSRMAADLDERPSDSAAATKNPRGRQ